MSHVVDKKNKKKKKQAHEHKRESKKTKTETKTRRTSGDAETQEKKRKSHRYRSTSTSASSSSSSSEEDTRRTKRTTKKIKKEVVDTTTFYPVDEQIDPLALLNQLVTVEHADDDDDNTTTTENEFGPTMHSYNVTKQRVTTANNIEDEMTRQMMPYYNNNNNNNNNNNGGVSVGKILECFQSFSAQQHAMSEKVVKHATAEASYKASYNASIQLAEANAKYQSGKMEAKYEMQVEQNIALEAKLKSLKTECKRLREENAALKQRQQPCLPYPGANTMASGGTATTTTSTTSTNTAYMEMNAAPIAGGANVALNTSVDELTRANRPHLSHLLQRGTFQRDIASMVHFRSEIPRFGFDAANDATLVVPITGVYCFYDLLGLACDSRPMAGTIEYDIAKVGIHLESNVYVTESVPQHGEPVRRGYAFDNTNTSAARFNNANLLQTILAYEIIIHLFTVLRVGDNDEHDVADEDALTTMDDEMDEDRTEETKKAGKQHQKKGKIRKEYDSAFQTSAKVRDLEAHIPEIERMALQAALFTKFYAIPVRARSYDTKKKQGGWKECIMCGAHCTFITTKTHLTNHIPKSCFYCLVSCASHQSTLAAKLKLDKPFTSTAASVVASVNRQMTVFDAVYKDIRPLVIRKYTKFFNATGIPVPTSFSATMIDSAGEPYQKTTLGDNILNIIDAGKRATCDYTRHADRYTSALNDDIRTATSILESYKRSGLSRVDIITNVFQHTLVTAVPLQNINLLRISNHESDLVIDNKAVDLYKLLAQHNNNNNNNSINNNQMPPLVAEPANEFTILADVIACDVAIDRLSNEYTTLESHRNNELAHDTNANVSVYDDRLAQISNEITNLQNDRIARDAVRVNAQNQSRQQTFGIPSFLQQVVPTQPQQQPQQQQWAQTTPNVYNWMFAPNAFAIHSPVSDTTTTTTTIHAQQETVQWTPPTSNMFNPVQPNAVPVTASNTPQQQQQQEMVLPSVATHTNNNVPQPTSLQPFSTTAVPYETGDQYRERMRAQSAPFFPSSMTFHVQSEELDQYEEGREESIFGGNDESSSNATFFPK